MGWTNPPIPWSELERRLSGRSVPGNPPPGEAPTGHGGDSPAWSRKRPAYQPPDPAPARARTRRAAVAYAELHCHSNYSFLDGASHPAELAETAAALGLEALALTDHDGLYGLVRFAEAASALGLPGVFGAELTLDGPRRSSSGSADPGGRHLVVLARNPDGYARLSRALSAAHMRAGKKSAPMSTLADLAALAGDPAHRGSWQVLTGCRKGTVPWALVEHGPAAAARELSALVDAFGRENVAVEIWDHGDPLDSVRNDALVALGVEAGVDVVATNNVHYATPGGRSLAAALAAVRSRRSLDDLDGWLPASASACLRSGAEQARRFARYPGVVERAAEIARACAFDLALVAPNLPDYPVPAGHDEVSWLRQLTARGAEGRYGRPSAERVPGAYRQITHELAMIESLGFAGYFLIVHDIVEFCRRSHIYCQGRGSAANSAVCYALGITNADAVALGLLFERFLSPERDGPPDIDLDIESDRREEVIQYVYGRYGRENAAQVANVVTYRPRSAVRDMGKALGHPPEVVDGWSKKIDGWHPSSADIAAEGIPAPVVDLARQVEGFPRHLGIHSGGMVICDRPVVEVCPVEWATMAGRSVLQWDKDDCAAVGLVKIDLLGLGMLSALHLGVDLIREHHGVDVDLALIPQESEVYDMLCAADTVGVFQVESRAQMATLPRLRPRTFYDLVVEVALIRPGPIQGGSVHPYIRRRNGREPVTYLHPLLEPSLRKTLGVPLFQEQMMQIAIDVAGFTPGEADRLRQAMGSKRSNERMEALRGRLYDGMAANGITGEVADAIYDKLSAFANFGFPESHSVSFAYLVYSSAWMKLHYPAAFCAALLNAQPMGFYSPNTLVADARRHGVTVLGPDVNASAAAATLECVTTDSGSDGGHPGPPGPPGPAVRLGIGSVRNVGEALAARIAERRPYSTMADLVRRTGATLPAVEALATAGALSSLVDSGSGATGSGAGVAGSGAPGSAGPGAGVAGSAGPRAGPGSRAAGPGAGGREVPSAVGPGAGRREALWAAGAVVQAGVGRLPGVVVGAEAPELAAMSDVEVTAADLWATGIATGSHPVEHVRPRLDEVGVIPVSGLVGVDDGRRVAVGGLVTHRQRPATAAGTVFVNLEDETGMLNVICQSGVWIRYRDVARSSVALVVKGRLEKAEGAVNLVAEKIEPLSLAAGTSVRSRNYR